MEIGTGGGIDVGLWEPTGERTADVSFFFADVEPHPDVVVRGVGKLAVEVDATGNASPPRLPLRPERLMGRCP